MENAKPNEVQQNHEPSLKELLDVMRAGRIPVAAVAYIMGIDEYELIEKLAEKPYTSEFDIELCNIFQQLDATEREYRYQHYDEYLKRRKEQKEREERQDDEA